ncbi:hypothetical protein B7463_g2447, partial [Scytalidium lignicola]
MESYGRYCVKRRLDEINSGTYTGARKDLLAKFFDIYAEKGEKVDFKLADIEQEAYIALFAGSDTTAIAFRAIIYYLLKNPLCYHEVIREIDEAYKNGLFTPNIRYTDATTHLPYFSACCKESMRLWPSVSMLLPRHVPPGGCEIAGKFIPEGYRVGMNAGVLHYNKDIFGADADQFNPNRWFTENAKNMDRYMFQFGMGPRTCIGKNISFSQIWKLLPQLFRTFEFELATPDLEWQTTNYFLNKQKNLEVIARLRF